MIDKVKTKVIAIMGKDDMQFHIPIKLDKLYDALEEIRRERMEKENNIKFTLPESSVGNSGDILCQVGDKISWVSPEEVEKRGLQPICWGNSLLCYDDLIE
jgi:hypothetical protein